MRHDSLIAAHRLHRRESMGFFEELAGRIDEAAVAGGKFADSLVRAAGATISGVLAFVDKEIKYAQKAAKRRPESKHASGKGPAH